MLLTGPISLQQHQHARGLEPGQPARHPHALQGLPLALNAAVATAVAAATTAALAAAALAAALARSLAAAHAAAVSAVALAGPVVATSEPVVAARGARSATAAAAALARLHLHRHVRRPGALRY